MATFLGPEYYFENDWKVYISEESQFRSMSAEDSMKDTSWDISTAEETTQQAFIEH
jgi:hypothetical protein